LTWIGRMARHCPVAQRTTHLGFTRRVRALRGQVTDSGTRSSRPAPAGAAWPLRAIVVIVPPRPVGSCLLGQLSSNVRPHLAWSCKRRGIGLRSKQAGGASRRVEARPQLHYGQGRRARRPVITALAPLRAASGSPPSAAPGAATLSGELRARGSASARLWFGAAAHRRCFAGPCPRPLACRSGWPLAHRPFRSLSAPHRMRPNNSLEPTRSGRRRLAAPGYRCHHPSAASRPLPPRSAQLQR